MNVVARLDHLIETAEVVRVPVRSEHEIKSVSGLDSDTLQVGHNFSGPFAAVPCVDQERRPVRSDDERAIALLDVDLVDGERVTDEVPLAPGALIRFGDVPCVFEPTDDTIDAPKGSSTRMISAFNPSDLPNPPSGSSGSGEGASR